MPKPAGRGETVRIGVGYDIHRLVGGRALILGGVKIDSEWGLEGHSDADVLCHAVGDALLGALALGDLGEHFPDSDPRYLGISSTRLLAHIIELIHEREYRVHNVDAVLVAQRPRLASHILDMRRNLAALLLTDLGSISVKAKTSEQLGALGRGEGIAAHAVCLLSPQHL
jgi:2-C-methyl-D-erythritol 2,4-cyclodiphosphate synthase